MRVVLRVLVAVALTTAAGVATAGSAGAVGAVTVTNGLDSGAGSLRAAIDAANADPGIGIVVIDPQVGTVTLGDTVEYTGAQALTIQGGGVIISPQAAAGDFDLLRTTGGAPLTIRSLTLSGSGAAGLAVQVPAAAQADQSLALDRVTVSGNARNGVYVDDCLGSDAPDQCPPDAIGSPAGVVLDLSQTTLQDNGNGELADFDGIRVDERSGGGVRVTIQSSSVTLNDADGIEVDESDAGDVTLTAKNSTFVDNGEQLQAVGDPEDAVDIDERGDGNVVTAFQQVDATGNYDENLDLNEADAGDLVSSLKQVSVVGARGGRGYDLEELGTGSIVSQLQGVTIADNADDGMRAQERDAGDVTVSVNQSSFSTNGDAGVELDQRGGGVGRADFKNSSFAGNAGAAIQDESTAGTMTITTKNVTGV